MDKLTKWLTSHATALVSLSAALGAAVANFGLADNPETHEVIVTVAVGTALIGRVVAAFTSAAVPTDKP